MSTERARFEGAVDGGMMGSSSTHRLHRQNCYSTVESRRLSLGHREPLQIDSTGLRQMIGAGRATSALASRGQKSSVCLPPRACSSASRRSCVRDNWPRLLLQQRAVLAPACGIGWLRVLERDPWPPPLVSLPRPMRLCLNACARDSGRIGRVGKAAGDGRTGTSSPRRYAAGCLTRLIVDRSSLSWRASVNPC